MVFYVVVARTTMTMRATGNYEFLMHNNRYSYVMWRTTIATWSRIFQCSRHDAIGMYSSIVSTSPIIAEMVWSYIWVFVVLHLKLLLGGSLLLGDPSKRDVSRKYFMTDKWTVVGVVDGILSIDTENNFFFLVDIEPLYHVELVWFIDTERPCNVDRDKNLQCTCLSSLESVHISIASANIKHEYL